MRKSTDIFDLIYTPCLCFPTPLLDDASSLVVTIMIA